MRSPTAKLLIGVGNVLHRDDAVGVRLVEALGSVCLPADVEAVDAGTAGLDATAVLAGRELVVVVDALEAEEEPGAIFRLEPEELRALVRTNLSLHDVHLLDALDETKLLDRAPGRVVVFGVQVADTSLGMGLSPPVEAALAQLVPLVAAEFGVPVETFANIHLAATKWGKPGHAGGPPCH